MKIISIQLSIENHFPIAKNLVWKKCSCNFISYLSCFKGQNFKRFGNKNAEKKKWLATFETFELWLSHIDEKVLKRSHGIFFSFLMRTLLLWNVTYLDFLSIVWIRFIFIRALIWFHALNWRELKSPLRASKLLSTIQKMNFLVKVAQIWVL